MKKLYESPDLEFIKVRFYEDVLVVSVDEDPTGGGTIIDPEPGMDDDGEDW